LTLIAHFYVLGIWLVLWVVFYGWGCLACSVSRANRDDAVALMINPFLGMSVIIGVLQFWHLFAPVNNYACWIVCALGALKTLQAFRSLSPSRISACTSPLGAVAFLLVALWLANRSLNNMPPYTDQGLYYLNTIRWQTNYPIVPGLANLHIRFGFNNSSFLLHAMLESLVGHGFSAHVLNGLIAVLTLPIIVQGFRWVLYGSAGERQAGWFTLCLAMLVATAVPDGRLYSATPDFPAAVLVTLAAWRLLVISAGNAEAQGTLLRWNILATTILASAAVTVKMHVMFFAAFAAVAFIAVVYRLNRDRTAAPITSTFRMTGLVFVWAALFIVPWIARCYVLTGYPMFPSTFAGLPVDWRYNQEVAANLRAIYHAWERAPTFDRSTAFEPGWGWVKGWLIQVVLLRAPIQLVLPALIAIAAIVWSGWKAFTRRGKAIASATALNSNALWSFAARALAVAYVAAVVTWFLTAPSARFGVFAMWGLAAICVGMASTTLSAEWIVRYRWLILGAWMACFVSPMVDDAARIELRYRKNTEHPQFGQHFYQYYPVVWHSGDGFPSVPQGELVEMKTKSGLAVYVAANKPDGYPGLVWDSPLPAARFFNADLELRRPGDLSSGFKTLTYGKPRYELHGRPRRWSDAEPRDTPNGPNEYKYLSP
jgi:hypothetical protein